MTIPVLGQQKEIYLESRGEIDLVSEFLDRRASDLETLTYDIEKRETMKFEAMLDSQDMLVNEREANLNLVIARLDARIAAARSRLAQIVLIAGIIDR